MFYGLLERIHFKIIHLFNVNAIVHRICAFNSGRGLYIFVNEQPAVVVYRKMPRSIVGMISISSAGSITYPLAVCIPARSPDRLIRSRGVGINIIGLIEGLRAIVNWRYFFV